MMMCTIIMLAALPERSQFDTDKMEYYVEQLDYKSLTLHS